MTFAQETPIYKQFAQQSKSRVMACEAAPKEMGNIKLRTLLARNRSFNRADVKVGDSARFPRGCLSRNRATFELAAGDFGYR